MPSAVLSEVEKHNLLRIARRSVEAAVTLHSDAFSVPDEGALAMRSGVFVTLRERGELRGCIGFIDSDRPLGETVREAAARAACEDPRFSPVTPEELRTVEIEISVLSPLRRVRNESEIEIGTHGLVVEALGRRGLLLPQVAIEFGWNSRMFLQQTLRKAGLPLPPSADIEVAMYVFTADVFNERSVSSVTDQ